MCGRFGLAAKKKPRRNGLLRGAVRLQIKTRVTLTRSQRFLAFYPDCSFDADDTEMQKPADQRAGFDFLLDRPGLCQYLTFRSRHLITEWQEVPMPQWFFAFFLIGDFDAKDIQMQKPADRGGL
jgi:hypothetical protein